MAADGGGPSPRLRRRPRRAASTAFIRLAEASGEARWIAEARQVADALLDLFWDDDRGGVFTTGRDAEAS